MEARRALLIFTRTIFVLVSILIIVSAVFISSLFIVHGRLVKEITAPPAAELKFIGGIMSLYCFEEEFRGLEDGINELLDMQKFISDQRKDCMSNFVGAVQCYIEYKQQVKDPIVWARAIDKVRRAYNTHKRFQDFLTRLYLAVSSISTYDENSRAVQKSTLVTVAVFRELDFFDFFRINQGWPKRASDSFARVMSTVDRWARSLIERYEEVDDLAMFFKVSPAIGVILTLEVLQDSKSELVMRQDRLYSQARTSGCLYGKDPVSKVFRGTNLSFGLGLIKRQR